jgi:hypothetical protein
MGGYQFTGWSVVFKLAKYDIILGKKWMEKVSPHIDLQPNILWLGQMALGGWYKYHMENRTWKDGGSRSEGTTMAASAKPNSTPWKETANMEASVRDLMVMVAQY